MEHAEMIRKAVGILILTSGFAWATGGPDIEVPPTIDVLLTKLPAKSIMEVLDDEGKIPKLGAEEAVDEAKLRADFATGPSPALVAEVDAMLVKARHNYVGPGDVNLLQDLRDVAAGHGKPDEVKEYVDFRLKHRDWLTPDLNQDHLKEIDGKIASASPELMPHWLYFKGAIYYKAIDDKNSEVNFDKVLKDFQYSARAETALFMKGRCKLSQSVSQDGDTPEQMAKMLPARAEAKEIFEAYLKKYPKGRYVNDVLGWLGGVEYRSNFPEAALGYYIQQIDNVDHPEDIRAAVIMIEKCLLNSPSTNGPFIDKIAQHPALALALTYCTVNNAWENSLQGDDSDKELEEKMKQARKQVLPKLAAAVLAHKDLYTGDRGQARYFAVLANAASDQGEETQAKGLIQMAGEQAKLNDDLAFVNAMVLRRSNDLDGAVTAFQDFVDRFPKSPLVRGAQYRLGLALHDQKKDGEALLELVAMTKNQLPLKPPTADSSNSSGDDEESLTDIDYSGTPECLVTQTIDAILNFAPIASLQTALDGTDTQRAQFRKDLRKILRERCLAAEDFSGAAKFEDDDSQQKQISAMASKVDLIKTATGAVGAGLNSDVASYWMSQQAKEAISIPLNAGEARDYVYGFGIVADLQRRVNGKYLDYGEIDHELQSRNNYLHGLLWWEKALAADPNGDKGAYEIWQALEAQRKFIATSLFTVQRGLDLKAQTESKRLYDLLEKRFPNSDEAKRDAAFWTFPDADALKQGVQGYSMPFPGISILDVYRGDGDSVEKEFEVTDSRTNSGGDVYTAICNSLAKLSADSSKMSADEYAKTTGKLLKQAHASISSMEEMWVVNCLEDLNAMAQVPSVPDELRAQYTLCRIGLGANAVFASVEGNDLSKLQVPKDLTPKAIKARSDAAVLADFIDCADLYQTANHLIDFPLPSRPTLDTHDEATYDSRDYSKLAQDSATFLTTYPKSVKREAAYVLRLRALVQFAWPARIHAYINWPETDSWDQAVGLDMVQGPFDPAAFDSTLAAYMQEFPHGAQMRSVRSIKARAEILEKKWGEALDDLMVMRADTGAPEFAYQTMLDLCTILNRLDDAGDRGEVLNAILARPACKKLLSGYISSDVGGLPYLTDFLHQKLGTK